MSEFHARLSPSGADRWMTCTASVAAEEQYEDSTSAFADEGTVAHAVGEKCLRGEHDATDFVGTEIVAPSARGNVVMEVTKSMADDVQVYVDYCRDVINDNNATDVWVEERVYYDEYVEDGSGTADLIVRYDEDGRKVLHVIDLKFGKGVPVDAYQNRQGMLYGLGALAVTEWDYDYADDDIVRISIHQPRIGDGEPSTYDITVKELKVFGREAQEASDKIKRGETEFVVTEKGCRFCKHRDKCDTRAEELLRLLKLEFDDEGIPDDAKLPEVESMTNEQIASIVLRAAEIKSFINSLEAKTLTEMIEGKEFPNLKVVEGRSIRKWRDENDAIDKLESLLEVSEVYVEKVISPAQAAKKLGRTKAKEIEDLIVKPRGKATLVSGDDKRPAFDPNASDADGFEDEDAA